MRLETWAVEADRLSRRGRPPVYFDPGFAVGQIEPTLTNTGFRVPQVSLVNHAGSITNVARGEVIERRVITGVFQPNNPCTLRDCLILGGPAAAYGSTLNHIDLRSPSIDVPVRIEHTTVDPSHRSVDSYGMGHGNLDAYRVKIIGCVDGASVHGTGSWPNTVMRVARFRACYFGDSPFYPVDPRQTDGSHNDFIQAHGSLKLLEVIGCSFGRDGARAMACILLQQHHGLYEDVVITDNWFYGHPTEGTVFNTSSQRGQAYSMLKLWRNRVDPDSRHAGGPPLICKDENRFPEAFGMVGEVGAHPNTWTPGPNANVYMGTGEPVYPRRG